MTMEHDRLDSHWKEVQVGSALRLINGRAFKSTEWAFSGTPIVRIQNLNNPESLFNYYQGELPDKYQINDGDLLFAWSGTPGTSFGAHIWHGGRAWLNQHIFKILFDHEQFDVKFLQLAINQNLTQYIAAAHGAAGLAHITKGRFEQSNLPCPKIGEQRRIASEVEKQFTLLDTSVSGLLRANANLKRYRASVLNAACSGRLLRNDNTLVINPSFAADDFPDIPSAWERTTLGAVIDDLQNGLYVPRNKYGSGVPILRINDYQNDRVSRIEDLQRVNVDDETARKYALLAGDLVINRVNSPSHLGKCMAVPASHVGSLFESNMMRVRFNERVDARFVEICLRAPSGRRNLLAGAKWAVNQASINQDDVKRMPLELPSIAEQLHIVAEVDRRVSIMDELRYAIAVGIKRAKVLRQTLLRRAFSGKS